MLFKERIIEAIKESKYTQKEIAKKLNITESNITNWKKGDNLPSIEILYKLCILLEESSDYLLGLEDESGAKLVNSNNINNSFNNFSNNGGNFTIK